MGSVGGYGGRRLATMLGPVGAWSWGIQYLPAAAARAATRDFETLGYPVVWIPEILGSKELFSHAAILLGASTRILVAAGIANIYARDPMAMANGARALGDAYPGRFVLGIGVSSERTVTLRGGTYGRPLGTMRTYLDGMAAASYAGPEPDPPVPLLLAAIGPRMLALAAERADGAHPFFVPIDHTPYARRILGPEPCLAVALTVALTTNPAAGRRIGRVFAHHYLGMPHHLSNLSRFGFSEADLAGEGSDRLIDAIVAWGDVDTIARRVRAHLDAGADQVSIMVRTDPATEPGLGAYRELAAALLETGRSRSGA